MKTTRLRRNRKMPISRRITTTGSPNGRSPNRCPLELEIAVAVGMEFFLSDDCGANRLRALWVSTCSGGNWPFWVAMALTPFLVGRSGLVVWPEVPLVPPRGAGLISFSPWARFLFLFKNVTQGVTALQISLLCRIVITLLNYTFFMALLLYLGSIL